MMFDDCDGDMIRFQVLPGAERSLAIRRQAGRQPESPLQGASMYPYRHTTDGSCAACQAALSASSDKKEAVQRLTRQLQTLTIVWPL
jgi:hypothetical protein